MIGALRGHVAGAGRGPTIGASIVSPAVVLGKTTDKSTPHDHFATSPDCRMIGSAARRVDELSGSPTVRGWIVSAARVQIRTVKSSPDDHLTSSPDCRKLLSAGRRIDCAGRRPTIGAGIVSPPGIQKAAITRGEGALLRLVGVHVSSVQPPKGPAITGSV